MIALVVTIIVLLILVGVAISLTVGNNGLFTRAENAANTWRRAELNEEEEIQSFANTYDETLNSLEIGKSESDTNVENTKKGILKDIIIGEDYGKYTNYSITYNRKTLDKWRIFYNNGTRVILILEDFLTTDFVTAELGLSTNGEYGVYGTNLLSGLNKAANWDTTSSFTFFGYTNEQKLYIRGGKQLDGYTLNYWLRSNCINEALWCVSCFGEGGLKFVGPTRDTNGVRPIVYLKESAEGIVGENVQILE